MKRLALAFVLAGVALPVGGALAMRIAPPPGPVRIVNSDAVFVGRVVELEPVDVEAKAFPGAKETIKYRIAIVKVNQVIRGLTNEKTLRVGFIPPAAPKPGVFTSGGGRGRPQLIAGQEGLFLISKHADGKFYLAPDYGYFVSRQDKNLDNEIKTARKVVAILADTKTALQSKDADERLMAASIVVAKYRTQKAPFPNKEEPISAEESKLILGAIAEAKWGPFMFGQAHPQQLFFQLGVGPKDDWKAPTKINGPDDLRKAVQAWIRDHGDYRIKRFVASHP
jgi:hypothetical protein